MRLLKKLRSVCAPSVSEPFRLKLGQTLPKPSIFYCGHRADRQVYVSQPDFLRHTGIFGKPGAGKTQFALNLAQQQIAAGAPVLFLDFKGDVDVRSKLQVWAATSGSAFRAFDFQDGKLAADYRTHLDTSLSRWDNSMWWHLFIPSVGDDPTSAYYAATRLIAGVLYGLRETAPGTSLSDLWPILESASALSEFAHRDGLSDGLREYLRAAADAYRTPGSGTFDETRFKTWMSTTRVQLKALELQLQPSQTAPAVEHLAACQPFDLIDAFEPGATTYLGVRRSGLSEYDLIQNIVLADLHEAIASRYRKTDRPEYPALVVLDGLPTQNRERLRLLREMQELGRVAKVGLVLVWDGPLTPKDEHEHEQTRLIANLYTRVLFSGSQKMAKLLSDSTFLQNKLNDLGPGQAFLLDPLREVVFQIAQPEKQ